MKAFGILVPDGYNSFILNAFKSLNHESPRRGIIIFVIFSLIGMIAVMAAIYLFTSGQSRLQSRRIFWGEAVMYAAESILDETFHEIKHRSKNPREEKIGGGAWFASALEEGFGGELVFDRAVSDYAVLKAFETGTLRLPGGLQLDPSQIRIFIKPNVLEAGPTEKLGPQEMLGSLEVEVQAKVPMEGSFRGSEIVRRVHGRRDFRLTSIVGNEPLLDYALFVKNAPEPNSRESTVRENRLLINPSMNASSEYSAMFGKMWLGTDSGDGVTDASSRQTRVLQGRRMSHSESTYLEQSQMLGEQKAGGGFEKQVRQPSQIANPLQNPGAGFLVSEVLKNPILQNVLSQKGIEIESLTQSNPDEATRIVGEFLAEEIGKGATLDMQTRIEPVPYPSLNLAYDSLAEGNGVEGLVVRLFGVSGGLRYQNFSFPLGPEDRPVSFVSHQLVPLHKILEGEDSSPRPVMSGVDGFSGQEDTVYEHIPWTSSKSFSYVYYAQNDMTAWEQFQRDHTLMLQSGKMHLKLDGITVLVGAVDLRQDTVVEGCGVLLATGPVSIGGGIEKLSGPDGPDCLILSSRTKAEDGMPASGIRIETDQPIHAMLQALGFRGDHQQATVTSKAQPAEIIGGVQAGRLRLEDLQYASRIQYDPAFSRAYTALSFGIPLNHYKIYNKVREGEL